MPRFWQPCQVSRSQEELTRIDLKVAEPGRSGQQTMKYGVSKEWFSGMPMVNRNLSHFCTIDNLVYMLSLFSLLRLIHVIVWYMRDTAKANGVPASFASVSS